MSLLRSVRPLELLALLLAIGAAVASVVVWDYGRVHLGLTLREEEGRVVVHDVTPDGNAHRHGFRPGTGIFELVTVSGAPVTRGEPIGVDIEGWGVSDPDAWTHLFGPVVNELHQIPEDYRLPSETVESTNIRALVGGDIDYDSGWINPYLVLHRDAIEFDLRESIWTLLLGAVVGGLTWLFLRQFAPPPVRRHAMLAGVATAVPFLLDPVVTVGTAAGIYGGYLMPIGAALLLAWSMARDRPADSGGVLAISGIAAIVAGLLVIRYVASPSLGSASPVGIYAAAAAVTLVPAIPRVANGTALREKASYLALGLVPVAAMTSLLATNPQPIFPIVLLALLLGWQAVPSAAFGHRVANAWSRVRPSHAVTAEHGPAESTRDVLLIGFFTVLALLGLTQSGSAVALAGIGLAAAVGWAVHRGFLGSDWTDLAVPLGVAVGVPVVVAAFTAWGFGGGMGWAPLATALSGLGVAHGLATRHGDPEWRDRLFLASVGLVGLAALLGGVEIALAMIAAALVPLVPGIPAAFADEPGETRALAWRLKTLAVALTPGAAATIYIPGTGVVLLGAWLVAVVVWGRFTLTPLIGLAQRTQLQRDLAVAAAETERARLAADLHDDALQQLTMLVRTLDEGGQKEAADEAREIATKLRAVVGDLRLPILDDLGAGAALEWLVERVEPLAGGPVKLERSDETRPPANVELAVFRVAQEALTNAIKHGRPPIAVRYDVRSDGRVTLAVDDAGEGIGEEAAEEAPKAGHFGLANMQQRAEQIGALLDVRRWPGGGTRVALEWRPSA